MFSIKAGDFGLVHDFYHLHSVTPSVTDGQDISDNSLSRKDMPGGEPCSSSGLFIGCRLAWHETLICNKGLANCFLVPSRASNMQHLAQGRICLNNPTDLLKKLTDLLKQSDGSALKILPVATLRQMLLIRLAFISTHGKLTWPSNARCLEGVPLEYRLLVTGTTRPEGHLEISCTRRQPAAELHSLRGSPS